IRYEVFPAEAALDHQSIQSAPSLPQRRQILRFGGLTDRDVEPNSATMLGNRNGGIRFYVIAKPMTEFAHADLWGCHVRALVCNHVKQCDTRHALCHPTSPVGHPVGDSNRAIRGFSALAVYRRRAGEGRTAGLQELEQVS